MLSIGHRNAKERIIRVASLGDFKNQNFTWLMILTSTCGCTDYTLIVSLFEVISVVQFSWSFYSSDTNHLATYRVLLSNIDLGRDRNNLVGCVVTLINVTIQIIIILKIISKNIANKKFLFRTIYKLFYEKNPWSKANYAKNLKFQARSVDLPLQRHFSHNSSWVLASLSAK